MYIYENNKLLIYKKNKIIKLLLLRKLRIKKIINFLNNYKNKIIIKKNTKIKKLNEEKSLILLIINISNKIKELNNEVSIINDIIMNYYFDVIELKNDRLYYINNLDYIKNNIYNPIENIIFYTNDIIRNIINDNNITLSKYILFNILSNEYYEIKCPLDKLNKMIEYLIHNKYTNEYKITTEQFIKNNKNIYNKYFKI
jgi:hypothetical protein